MDTDIRVDGYQAIVNVACGLLYFGGNLTQTMNESDAKLGWNCTC